ncbi:hypothetical protein LguiA_033224 [Lonicera macranthoides]
MGLFSNFFQSFPLKPSLSLCPSLQYISYILILSSSSSSIVFPLSLYIYIYN